MPQSTAVLDEEPEYVENENLATSKLSYSIVLAGGSGQRMRDFVIEWLGDAVPKQYCCFTGSKTMIEHTIDRASEVSIADRIITLAAKEHAQFAQAIECPGPLIFQPCAKGTAPGILLPLAAIVAENPTATVHILPSDHFIFPKIDFTKQLRDAEEVVKQHPDRLVTLAAKAALPETDYGWIQKDARTPFGSTAFAVTNFHEKPNAELAGDYLSYGYSWNTMIMTVRAATLWGIAWDLYPEMMEKFQKLSNAWEPKIRQFPKRLLEKTYRAIDEYDFSKDLVEKIVNRVCVIEMQDLMWNDWGRPSRVLETLNEISRQPNFNLNTKEKTVEKSSLLDLSFDAKNGQVICA
ncbi:MAG: sugar phosphate nucleotidyltransferase [Pseudomonadota bacterium]